MTSFSFFSRNKAEVNAPGRRKWVVAVGVLLVAVAVCGAFLLPDKEEPSLEQPIDYIDMPYFDYDPISSFQRGLKFKLTVPADGVSMELSADGGQFTVYPVDYENDRRVDPLFDRVTSITLSYDCIVYWSCSSNDRLNTTHGQILLRKDGNLVGYSVLAFASAYEDVPEYWEHWTAPGPYIPQLLCSVAVPLVDEEQQYLEEEYVAQQIAKIKEEQHSVDTIKSKEFHQYLRECKEGFNHMREVYGDSFRFPLD